MTTTTKTKEIPEQAAKLFETVKDAATENFNRDHEVAPVILFFNGDGVAIVLAPMAGPEDKRNVARFFHFAAEEGGAAVLVTEMWFKRVPMDVIKHQQEIGEPITAPRNMPDRQEAIMVQLRLRGGRVIAWISEINRNTEPPTLEPWRELGDTAESNLVTTTFE